MARLLVLCDEFPEDMTNGCCLRVRYLCEQLAQKHECFLVAQHDGDENTGRDSNDPFTDIHLTPRIRPEHRSFVRHFRSSNARFVERSFPEFFHFAHDEVCSRVKHWQVDAIICFPSAFAEIGARIALPRILDYPDCDTLAIERMLANPTRKFSAAGKLALRIKRHRQIKRERWLLNKYDFVTTISAPDRCRFLEISGMSNEKIKVVANGVSSDLFCDSDGVRKQPRSIVFWGNLDFAPNQTAIRYFYDQIFLPYLDGKDVDWFIVGRGIDKDMLRIGEHQNIHFVGYQNDLREFISDKCVTVNPMVEGGGLKNKVIESFAMGVPVVTSSLGVDAIAGEDGKHYIVADTPAHFARAIFALLENTKDAQEMAKNSKELVRDRYSWPAIGEAYEKVIAELLRPREAGGRSKMRIRGTAN